MKQINICLQARKNLGPVVPMGPRVFATLYRMYFNALATSLKQFLGFQDNNFNSELKTALIPSITIDQFEALEGKTEI